MWSAPARRDRSRIVLDECHHLLELWGYLVRAVIEELGPETFVVGLTATPPDLLTGREATLYQSIFGQANFAVPTPAVVKEGDLAPYQELVRLVEPMEHEARYIAEQHDRFQALLSRLLDPEFASCSLVQWLRQRVVDRQSHTGATRELDRRSSGQDRRWRWRLCAFCTSTISICRRECG